jgi:hypothetical protein
MFVVAITTEDGCFLSGRSERFEFGHLYSLSPRDMAFDMANISIATGKREEPASAAAGVPHGRRAPLGSDKTSSDENHESSDSEQSVHCLCDFDSGDPFNPNDISIDDPQEECIHRGVTGPGLWHCYVAVFDGKNSVIVSLPFNIFQFNQFTIMLYSTFTAHLEGRWSPGAKADTRKLWVARER